jgi:NRPS condensation-like uncharacterized protein
MPFDPASKPAVLRPLSAFEKLFWFADQTRALHFALAAEVSGLARADQWQNAIDQVCRQSTLVWSRIVPDENGVPCFVPVAPDSIALRVIENDLSNWTTRVAAELERTFDASRAPLLRATLVQEDDRSVIILCVHHSIADGLSLAILIREILRALAGETVRLNPETASTEDLIGVGSEKWPIDMPAGAGSPMHYRPLDGTRACVEAVALDQETTRRLRVRARTEGSTVHGALCAAMAMAASRLVPSWSETPLRIISPVDLRRRMLGGSEHVGLCVTGVVLENEFSARDFWTKARSFSDRLEPATSAESIAAKIAAMHQLATPISTVQQAREFLLQAFSAEILLTNLGVVDFNETYGALTLRALWGPATHTGFALGQTIGAVTVKGQLHLLHTSYGPAIDLLGEAVLTLEAAS